jgi:hypothetical protein
MQKHLFFYKNGAFRCLKWERGAKGFHIIVTGKLWVCLGTWLWLFFKVVFVLKYIKIIFFYFLKNYFWDQRIKTIQNIQKKLIFSKTKKIEFFGNAGWPAFPNRLYVTVANSVRKRRQTCVFKKLNFFC